MVLAGIGGRTIAEAKAAMTVAEATTWLAYRRRRGSFHTGLRIEENFAHLLAMLHNMVAEEKVTVDSYMPHVILRPPEQEQSADIGAVFGLLTTVAKTNNAPPDARAQRRKR